MTEKQRHLARARNFDLMIEDHGLLVLAGHFDYEGWGSQGLGYQVDANFLKRFMEVFRVERLQQVNGRPCWVTQSSDRIHMIEPLFAGEGTVFDIDAWAAEKRKEARS